MASGQLEQKCWPQFRLKFRILGIFLRTNSLIVNQTQWQAPPVPADDLTLLKSSSVEELEMSNVLEPMRKTYLSMKFRASPKETWGLSGPVHTGSVSCVVVFLSVSTWKILMQHKCELQPKRWHQESLSTHHLDRSFPQWVQRCEFHRGTRSLWILTSLYHHLDDWLSTEVCWTNTNFKWRKKDFNRFSDSIKRIGL